MMPTITFGTCPMDTENKEALWEAFKADAVDFEWDTTNFVLVGSSGENAPAVYLENAPCVHGIRDMVVRGASQVITDIDWVGIYNEAWSWSADHLHDTPQEKRECKIIWLISKGFYRSAVYDRIRSEWVFTTVEEDMFDTRSEAGRELAMLRKEMGW